MSAQRQAEPPLALASARADAVLVFLPSFGDDDEIPRLAAAIEGLGEQYWTLVIDDGSQRPVARPEGRRCLSVRFPANFGLGNCLDVAFSHALTYGYGAVVRLDADGQHEVGDIPKLLEPIHAGRADMVVGQRTNQYSEAMRAGLARRILKGYFSLLARLITRGAAPDDVNSGFFALNRAALSQLQGVKFERFPEPELFVQACLSGLRVTSVDVEQRQRMHGRSTLGVISALRVLFRFNLFVAGQLFRRARR